MASRNVSITDRDLDALAAVAMSEMSGVLPGYDWAGNVRGVVDSVISRAAAGKAGGWPSSIQGVIDQGKGTKSPQYSGIGKAGGWENYSRNNRGKMNERDVRSLKDAITDRLAEIAASGRVTLAPDFQNIGTVLGSKASASSKKDSRSLADRNVSGPLSAPGGFHTYGITDRARETLARSGIVGPGLSVSLSFDEHLSPVMDNLIGNVQRADNPVERNLAGLEAQRATDFRDFTDVLANEQLGVPDVPGPLAGMPAPEFSLADLGGIPDRSMGSFYDSAPDYSDISRGILHDTDQARGLTGNPYAANEDPNIGPQPDFSSITAGIFGDQAPRNGIGLGVTGYGPGALGTEAMPAIGPYDPLGAAREAFPDQAAPPVNDILNDAFGRPATDVFSGQPMGAPQGFGNYGAGEIGYPSGSFASQPSRPSATDISLAGLSPVGQGVVGVGYNPSVVAAASPIGAPAARGMSFDQMTRGIVGYEDKPVTTTTQVANPAWSEWSKDFTKNNALQEAYLNDEMDRHGPAKPTNVPNYEWSPEPARTVSRTTTTTQRSPVYGDVPVGQPIGANLSQAGAGSWTSGLTNQANTIGAQINDFSNFGLEGFTGNFGTGIGDPSGGMSLGGLGGVGGGFSGALGGSYGPGGQPLGGSENQGGAGYGGSFSGSQGSDPSGRGGLY